MSKRLQQVALFFDAAHSTSSEVIDFDEFLSSTNVIPLTPYVLDEEDDECLSDTGTKESVQVALLPDSR